MEVILAPPDAVRHDVESIVIPALYCPFPPSTGERQDTTEIHAGMMAWAEQLGLLTTDAEREFADGNRIAWGLGLAHAKASREPFRLLADWLLHFCLFDSYVEEHLQAPQIADVCGRLLDVLRGQKVVSTDTPYVMAINDIRQRLVRLAREGSIISRFIETLRNCYDVYCHDYKLSLRGLVSHPESHLEFKTRTGGFYSWWVLMEVVEDVRVPPEVCAHPLIQATLRLAAEAGELANDLFTLRREIDQGNPNNLVLKLGIPIPAAIAQVASLHDTTMKALVTNIEQISHLEFFSREVERWLNLVGGTLRAHIDWAQSSQRALGWRPIAPSCSPPEEHETRSGVPAGPRGRG